MALGNKRSAFVRNVGMLFPLTLKLAHRELFPSHLFHHFFSGASISVCPSFMIYLLHSSTYLSFQPATSDVGLSFRPFCSINANHFVNCDSQQNQSTALCPCRVDKRGATHQRVSRISALLKGTRLLNFEANSSRSQKQPVESHLPGRDAYDISKWTTTQAGQPTYEIRSNGYRMQHFTSTFMPDQNVLPFLYKITLQQSKVTQLLKSYTRFIYKNQTVSRVIHTKCSLSLLYAFRHCYAIFWNFTH